MWIVSPWSRGGWVNSQVHGHTSILQFLEKRFGVAEPQISDYRRAVCGDLTSCFNFVNPNNDTLAPLDGRTAKTAVDARILAQTKAATLAKPTASTTADRPAQVTGTRPSRALPYELPRPRPTRSTAASSSLSPIRAERTWAPWAPCSMSTTSCIWIRLHAAIPWKQARL